MLRRMLKSVWRWSWRLAVGCFATLTLAAGAMWIRSYWRVDFVRYDVNETVPGGREIWNTWLGSRGGSVIWQRQGLERRVRISGPFSHRGWQRGSVPRAQYVGQMTPSGTGVSRFAGFSFTRRESWPLPEQRESYSEVGVPYWTLVLVSAGGLIIAWRQVRRDSLPARRRAAGLCVACGYDLR